MRTRPVLSLLPIVVLAATGCGDSPAANASSVPESERVAAPVAPAASHALAAAIEVARVRVEKVASTGEAEKARETLIAEQGSFHRGLDLLYEALGGKPYFAAEGALGEEVAPALLAFIDELDGHALDAAPYGKDALVAAHMAWQEAHERARTIRTRTADLRSREDRVRSAVRRWILAPPDLPGAAPGTTDSSPLATRLAAVGLSDEAIAHVEAVTVDAEQLAEAEAVEREALYKLDPLLVRALMQAVLDFRMVKRVHPKLALEHPERAPDYYAERLIALIAPETKPAPPEEKEEDAETGKKGKKKAKKEKDEEPPDEIVVTDADPRRDLAAFLADLIPPIAIYARTMEAVARYRELAAKEAEQAPPNVAKRGKDLKRRKKGPEIAALEERLAFEGYYPAREDGKYEGRFDKNVEEAVKRYQKYHQLDESGVVERLTRGSLRRPMSYRLRQLELSLQRFRESDINKRRPTYYLRVNIPEFSVEMWEDGALVRKHRVIVGNNNWEEDHKRKVVGNLNRTRMFDAVVTTVNLNPFWRVPKRIKVFELDEYLLENPDFYERNHYEVTLTNSGHEVVRQMPSDGNALGRVKINFPNPHSIFMHDTAKRPLFKRTFRAYSHGCVRLDQALEFALFLLERDRGMEEEEFTEILDSFEEKVLRLERKLPIYIEYNVTTVDEEGQPYFLTDVYRYDAAVYDGELPVVNEYELEAWNEGEKVPFKGVVAVKKL